MYSEEELKRIRESITTKVPPSKELLEKMLGDPKTRLFPINFAPEAYPLFYGEGPDPQLRIETGTRGYTVVLNHPAKNLVIKPHQSEQEPHIAKLAGELVVGPRQYASIDGFLTEEFLEGTTFNGLPEEKRTTDTGYALGRRVGEMLTTLHKNDIYFNDTTVSDDCGKSHIMVPPKGDARLFDFGAAVLLDTFPDLTDDAVFNYARTLPGINMVVEMGQTPQERIDLVRDFRVELATMSKGDVFRRDRQFVEEGLSLASYRFERIVLEAFAKGFTETYEK